MMTCPLFDELDWIKHGFYNRDAGMTNTVTGLQSFADFPQALFLPQSHSDCIAMPDQLPDHADASYTTQNNIALAVKTADCAPILLACTSSKMIAAIHAGWPGALNQIIIKTTAKMKEHGADPKAIIAAIGPCLAPPYFAVQANVRDKFCGQLPDAMDFFEPFEDRWQLNLAGIIDQQLKKSGVQKIWHSPINTFADKHYFSYRRRGSDPDSNAMRNVSVLAKITP